MTQKLVTLATCVKMTPAQQRAYTASLITEAGGELSKVSKSYSLLNSEHIMAPSFTNNSEHMQETMDLSKADYCVNQSINKYIYNTLVKHYCLLV